MKGNKKKGYSSFVSLLLVASALFCFCAHQRESLSSGEATSDDEYKQQLLQLLQLTEDQVPQQTEPGEAKIGAKDAEDSTKEPAATDDVLALLLAEDHQPSTTTDAPQKLKTDDVALSAEMFKKVQEDITRLEKKLQQRTASIDSLRRMIENRDRRISELERQPLTQPSRLGSSRRSTPLASRRKMDPDFVARYQQGRNQFERFQYQAAIETFQKLLADFPNHPMTDNCQYWIGECYFGMKQFQQAIIEFQKVFSYSETNKHDDAQLMIAISYLRLGQTEKAQKEFELFLKNYSTSEYASIAKRYYRSI